MDRACGALCWQARRASDYDAFLNRAAEAADPEGVLDKELALKHLFTPGHISGQQEAGRVGGGRTQLSYGGTLLMATGHPVRGRRARARVCACVCA